jgi:hypothetical protein
VWPAEGERLWGVASGGGGRQLVVWGGRTQRRGARGVVQSVKERLERAVHGGVHRAGRSGGEGLEGLSGPELEGSKDAAVGTTRGENRGGTGAEDGGLKGGARRWGAPLIATRGDGRGRRNWWAANTMGGEVMGAGKQRWPLSKGGRRGPDAVGPWFGPGD